MSWYYEGECYHSHAAYQAAVRASELNRARAETSSPPPEPQPNARSVRETERELQAADAELQQQRALHNLLSMQINDLHHTQLRLSAAQHAMREQISEGFAEFKYEIDNLAEVLQTAVQLLNSLQQPNAAKKGGVA